MKIAKIFIGDPGNQKGFFNNVIERTKRLISTKSYVDCYIIRVNYSFTLNLLKGNLKSSSYEEYTLINKINFKNLWVRLGLINYLLSQKLHKKVVMNELELRKYIELFKDYDLISCHGIEAIYLAKLIKENYNIPYVATWHGSDINIIPFRSSSTKFEIKKLLTYADHNFFVSEELMKVSSTISANARKSVLYTGPSEIFYRYNNKKEIRKNYSLNTEYVIGFIGNFVSIKNVMVLPLIFKKLQEELKSISFVLVGNGVLGKELEKNFSNQNIKNFHMFGKKDPKEIPNIMNCLDVLVLPSLNEGMPRVALEAQACGVHVVGSNRGGIPEAIGIENCFDLDDDFVRKISYRIKELLNDTSQLPKLNEKFSWDNALKNELMVYTNVCSK